MSTNELDPHLIKCIGLLYESKKLRKGDVVPLQYMLEEAIYQKTGITKDYTDLFQACLPPREDDLDCQIIEAEKGSNSDNDLELDLLQEDLMCVVCKKMDVGARNRLLECHDCHALYHQECHRPVVTDEELVDNWICSNCKSISISTSKKLKISESSSSTKEHSSGSLNRSSSSKSSSHKHGSSSGSSSHKSSSSDKHKSSSSHKSSPSGSSSVEKKSSSSSSSSKSKSSSSKHGEKRKHD